MLYRNSKSVNLQDVEKAYLKVRAKEERIYSDEQVKRLPEISKTHSQYNEWQIRKDSLKKIVECIGQQSTAKRVLDLGCGNGWMSNAIQQKGYDVVGVDINQLELEQAARLFPHCTFYERDIFDDTTDFHQFDVIVISAALQYFQQPLKLIKKLKEELLVNNGQILIADTKFYKTEEIGAARMRSENYYHSLQVDDMVHHYFHHNVEILHQMNAQVVRNNSNFETLINRFKGIRNPFKLYSIKQN